MVDACIDFHSRKQIPWKSMCLVTNILQNTFFWFNGKKKLIQYNSRVSK